MAILAIFEQRTLVPAALGYNEDLSGLRLSRAHHTFLPKCFMLDHACCLPHSAKQDGLRYVPFLFRRGS